MGKYLGSTLACFPSKSLTRPLLVHEEHLAPFHQLFSSWLNSKINICLRKIHNLIFWKLNLVLGMPPSARPPKEFPKTTSRAKRRGKCRRQGLRPARWRGVESGEGKVFALLAEDLPKDRGARWWDLHLGRWRCRPRNRRTKPESSPRSVGPPPEL